VTVPRDVPDAVVRARLRVVDPHHDLAFDIGKIVVVVALIVLGIVLRLRPMPERVVGGGLIAVGVFLLAVWGKRATHRPRDRQRRLVAALGPRPFPIDGYAMWLCADEPVLDVVLAQPAKSSSQVIAQLRALDAEAVLTQLDDRTVRVVLPARQLAGARGGDPDRLRRFLDRWPAERAIERLELGGTSFGASALVN
jgi:hypothetical protein